MLSRTYIDYRKANIEELQENFTISNLKRDKDLNNNDKNITTKSFILTPYNSLICGEDDSMDEIEKFRVEKGYAFFNLKNGEQRKISLTTAKTVVRKNCNICVELTSETSDISIGSIG